jgi:hypothetical protein
MALDDTGNIWANLKTIGVPYTIRLANMFNHPNDEGHVYFAELIMRLLKP